ncbi:SUMF1/EgtB/PvdO family nonheme iron enzyme [uncultured Treponema sp.]|uniref:SUMF1/EgtB/PvdO family nonheme iron enzyme n=1 Tax=uncultured Treponema sp. TaxID=162155 RepID=UPI0025D39EF5|nr:SUMF1/EgtB/PvdO family nonheme iron enzyme [uncultured Treponema sp.]
MKIFKKSFTWTSGCKRSLSFASSIICGIILLAVTLQISCSNPGDDNGDSTIESTFEGADVDKNNSGETKPDGGEDNSNPDETKLDTVKAALAVGVTYKNVCKLMIAVPGKEFSILATEVTQELYESVTGENPSENKGEKNLPVENISWNDAIYFCNELSKKCGLPPVYAVDDKTEAKEWMYDSENKIIGTIN